MTWMINIIRNRAIDALRASRQERARRTPLEESDSLGLAAPGPDPLRALADGRSADQRRVRVSGLSSGQRQALVLAYFHGMSHREVASTLHAPLGTTKGWILRGLTKLRSSVQDTESPLRD